MRSSCKTWGYKSIIGYFNSMETKKKAVVFTLGCKVNARESASIMSGLTEKGFEVSDKIEPADVYVINTCAVTAEAEKKSRQAVARMRKCNPDALIYVCGCASQRDPEAFAEKGVKVVVGAKSKDKLIELLDNDGVYIEKSDDYYEKYLPCKTSRTREYVKVQDGCDNFCSYCIIPYLRGRSRSRKIENVIKEIEALSPLEAVITGINISSYSDGGKGLDQLIAALSHINCRIRLGSVEVNVIDEKFLEATKKLKDFAPHFHLSLQSGSDHVLKTMNRRYTAEEYYEKVLLIRKYYPDAAITTDVIVGYSTETEEDFLESVAFCRKVEFSDIHCFPYSVRQGTAGARLKKLPDEVKKDRLNRLLQVKAELKSAYINKHLGKTLTVIPEEIEDGYVVGYTENYIRVFLKGEMKNGEFKVVLKQPFKDGALAEYAD